MNAPQTFGVIMMLLIIALFLILMWYFIKATGNWDFIVEGFKMFFGGNSTVI